MLPTTHPSRTMLRLRQWLMLTISATVFLLLSACNGSGSEGQAARQNALLAAKAGFQTKIVTEAEVVGAAEVPPADVFERIHFPAPVGDLVAYLTPNPGDGQRHPAIIWITGGDNNSIGDVWSPTSTENDQSAAGFRQAGMIMMFPSQRGGNDNPGRREGFLGEVDDILAAHQYLAALPYVDPQRIYLGGHSTGGTLAMLVAESTDVFTATFAFGPVASPLHYGGAFVYCNPADEDEMSRRSPLFWLADVTRPLYVIEGAEQGNWESIAFMVEQNQNPNIQFHQIPGHSHFSVLHPVIANLARAITQDQGRIDPQTFTLTE